MEKKISYVKKKIFRCENKKRDGIYSSRRKVSGEKDSLKNL